MPRHIHSIYDTDLHFIIDPITRKITSESGKVNLMQNDHLSERFTFEVPRYVEGHDMSLTDKVEVHYINIDGSNKRAQNKDIYEVADLQISPDSPDMVICSWLLSKNATMLAGSLSFVLRFVCYSEDTIDYQWFTDVYSGIKILSAIYNSEVLDDTYDIDVVESWKRDIVDATAALVESAKESADKAKESETIILDTEARIADMVQAAVNVEDNVEYIKGQMAISTEWAEKAVASADSAIHSAADALASATNAKESENRAEIHMNAAARVETRVIESEINAAKSANDAANSASDAAQSAANASAASTNARTSATNAHQSEVDAETAAANAAKSETLSDENFKMAKSYAVGETGVRDGEDIDNAKYYAKSAESMKNEALTTLDEIKQVASEVTKQTSTVEFRMNFETGQLEYDSDMYEFTINPLNGKLEWEVR